MCVETAPKSGCGKSSCGCGGHGHKSRWPTPADARAILAMQFGEKAGHECSCSGHICPRRYLAATGLMLGGFLVLHLAVNVLGWWPARFQSAVNRLHGLGVALPFLEIGLIFMPLTVHVALGIRTLRREKLKFGIEKPHQGSDLRQWLQRVSALVLLAFVPFHVVTMHRGLGERFDPHFAFNSASSAIWQFWRGLPAGHPLNLLVAEFYLLGILAAVYHLANGIATGADVLSLTRTRQHPQRLWHICIAASVLLVVVGMATWGAFMVLPAAGN